MGVPAIVVCPLRFERRALRAFGVGDLVTIDCCGPGAEAIERWAAAIEPVVPVILAGLAGALREGHPVTEARCVAAVLDAEGGRIEPVLAAPQDAPTATVTSFPATVTSGDLKRELGEETGADLVDLESAAFARVAAARGWRWAIVRGVADGPETELPSGIDAWVTPDGRARLGRVLLDLACFRAGLGGVLELHTNGRLAMMRVAALVRRLLDELVA